ncbi:MULTISPECIES: MliC family protein [unclassified Bartonella]|uniref:MliC family protein n=1 Tax=unclassified Bartonella TaxID=2645622 RepID=UPI0023600845|nr:MULTISPECIES: MliC family protein [unclassified Bartonella]
MKKTSSKLRSCAALSLLFCSSINALAGSLVIEVPDDPAPTTEIATYQCDMRKNKESIEATYYTAGDIALVDFKWKGKRIVGSNVIAASGAKYVSGQYVWWTTKNEALFYDLINDPKEENPIRCIEEQSAQ